MASGKSLELQKIPGRIYTLVGDAYYTNRAERRKKWRLHNRQRRQAYSSR